MPVTGARSLTTTSTPAKRGRSAGPRGPRNAEPAGDRRRELVEATFTLIAEKGLEGLRTRDVASRVGINVATLHYHFPTKQDLIVAVVEYVSELFRTMRPPLPAKATSLDELNWILHGQSYRHQIAPHLEVVVQELMLRARRDEHVRKVIEQQQSEWHAIVTDTILRCVRDGFISPDVDPKAVANVLTTFLIGVSVQIAVKPPSFSLKEAARQLATWLEIDERAR